MNKRITPTDYSNRIQNIVNNINTNYLHNINLKYTIKSSKNSIGDYTYEVNKYYNMGNNIHVDTVFRGKAKETLAYVNGLADAFNIITNI